MKFDYVVRLAIIRDELSDAKKWSDIERVTQMLNRLLDEVE